MVFELSLEKGGYVRRRRGTGIWWDGMGWDWGCHRLGGVVCVSVCARREVGVCLERVCGGREEGAG